LFSFKTGKLPPTKKISFNFHNFFNFKEASLNIPRRFGHYNLIDVSDWGMLANDKHGCCVFSDFGHVTRLAAAEGGLIIKPTDEEVLQMYSEVTGFNPNDPTTDNGTSMAQAASYRRKEGVLVQGQRYKTEAYTSLATGSESFLTELEAAVYYFGSVDIGIEFPISAGEQFDKAEPWSVVHGSKVDGGHCIPIIGRNDAGNWVTVTWGRLQAITPQFLLEYCDESFVHLSKLPLRPLSPEHYDYNKLQEELSKL